MKLTTYYQGLELHRSDKIVIAKFLTPHRLLSTCRAAGGLREDLDFLYNHQSCEPNRHVLSKEIHEMAVHNPGEYRAFVTAKHDLPPEKCATLGTAANMHHLAISAAKHQGLEVIAACTGGVETNAGRAGDPASYVQDAGEFIMLDSDQKTQNPESGTIVCMLFINQELTPGAMVTAVITATEAKSAVLQELNVPSRYSDGLATGTGTDQIAVASRMGSENPLTDAGKHSKLGELIGKTIKESVRETLGKQNGLTSLSVRSIRYHLERFGASQESLVHGIASHLDEENAALLHRNYPVVDGDPVTVAAVASLVHVRDKLDWEVLPKSVLQEILVGGAAQLAAAVSGKKDRYPYYFQTLSEKELLLENDDFLDLIHRAAALGYSEKWV